MPAQGRTIRSIPRSARKGQAILSSFDQHPPVRAPGCLIARQDRGECVVQLAPRLRNDDAALHQHRASGNISRMREFIIRRLRRAPIIKPLWDKYERMMAARDAAVVERDRAVTERDAAVAQRDEILGNEYVRMVFGNHPTHALIADREPTDLFESDSPADFASRDNAKLKVLGGEIIDVPPPLNPTGKHGDFFIKNTQPWLPISLGRMRFPDRWLYTKSPVYLSNVPRAEGVLFDKFGIYCPDEQARGFDYAVAGDSNNIVFHRKFALVKFSDWPTIDGLSLIYFDVNFANYYHWLIDALPKLYLMREAMGLSGNVIFPGGEQAITEWQRASLSILGSNIMFLPSGTQVFKLEAAAWTTIMGMTECSSPLLRDLASFVKKSVGKGARGSGSQFGRLYISRQGKRGVLNNEEVASVLSGYGFTTIKPETMPFAEQVSVFSQANVVVGAHGAGLSNIIFCDGPAAVVELLPWAESRPFFWAICNRFGYRHTYLRCQSPAGPSFYGPGDMPFTVCIADLRTAIEDALRHVA